MLDWIEWTGGHSPIKEGEEFEIKLRYGKVGWFANDHGLDWSHSPEDSDDYDSDIVAYRITSNA